MTKQSNRRKLRCEVMEARLCLAAPIASMNGIDSIALGDVNGDEVADIAVASHADGHEYVTIYGGNGQYVGTKSTTKYAAAPLITLTDPLGLGSGPLSIALGDFAGTGTAQLAVAPSMATPHGATPRAIKVFSFVANDGSSPIGSTVSAQVMGKPLAFTAQQSNPGFNLAAEINPDTGVAKLVVAPGGAGGPTLTVDTYQAATQTWKAESVALPTSVNRTAGVSVAAGDLSGDGVDDIAIGSLANGTVAVLDGKTGKWLASQTPLGAKAKDVRVAITTAAKDEPGALVAAGTTSTGEREAVAWTWNTATAALNAPLAATTLPDNPGTKAGTLVMAGAGMVYQRSTFTAGAHPKSLGPIAPTVLLGSTAEATSADGDSLVVQGFTLPAAPAAGSSSSGGTTTGTTPAGFVPSAPDTFVEHLGPASTKGFVPLQSRSDAALGTTTSSSTSATSLLDVDSNLVVVPATAWKSPYSITLPRAASWVYQGLDATTPVSFSASTDYWGPTVDQRDPTTLPTITDASAGAATIEAELRDRLIAAYKSAIGVDYQYHHRPFWLPAQDSPWNVVATVGYQSEGLDCSDLTNWAYNDALGIKLDTGIGQLGDTTAADFTGTAIPSSLQSYVKPTTIDETAWGDPTSYTKPTDAATLAAYNKQVHATYVTVAAGLAAYNARMQADYQKMVGLLQPGDLLLVDGDPTSTSATHVVTWLGNYATDANGVDQHLIIDSTGITPNHIDSNNHVVKEGVEIRPFGAPSSANNWYFLHVDHVLRLIGTDPAAKS